MGRTDAFDVCVAKQQDALAQPSNHQTGLRWSDRSAIVNGSKTSTSKHLVAAQSRQQSCPYYLSDRNLNK